LIIVTFLVNYNNKSKILIKTYKNLNKKKVPALGESNRGHLPPLRHAPGRSRPTLPQGPPE
jgi:hypothetical protein